MPTKTPKPIKPVKADKAFIAELRKAVADYMGSEGCSCCCNVEAHHEHNKRLAKLLRVPMHSDKSGYDFSKYREKPVTITPEKKGGRR